MLKPFSLQAIGNYRFHQETGNDKHYPKNPDPLLYSYSDIELNPFICFFKMSEFDIQKLLGYFYSSSPEYPAACCRDEWRGEPRRSSPERRRVGYDAIPLDTPPHAAGSFIRYPAIPFLLTRKYYYYN